MFVKKRSPRFNGHTTAPSLFRKKGRKSIGLIFLFTFLCCNASLGGRGPKGMAGEEEGSRKGRSVSPVTFANYEEKVDSFMSSRKKGAKFSHEDKGKLYQLLSFERTQRGIEPQMHTYLQRKAPALLKELLERR